MNVAISRARCLAVLVCSPDLLRVACSTAAQIPLANALCSYVAQATPLGRVEEPEPAQLLML